jgi:hypothetical protein
MSDRVYYSREAEQRAQRDNVLLALMVLTFGLGIGVVIALLLAPRSGDDMRRAIADEVNRIRKEAEDRLGR